MGCRIHQVSEAVYKVICNAIYDHLKTGCQWDMLPGDFPPRATVYSYYRKWQKRGIWEELNHTLRARLREKMGRLAQPSAIAADSQSVKTTEKRGFKIYFRVSGIKPW